MNYNKPALLDSLAGQYVLGTLSSLARKRFQRIMLSNSKAREATAMWEQNLNHLASTVTPQAPSDQVWEKILQRIENRAQTTKTVIRAPSSIWRSWSLVATAASLLLAFLVMQPSNNVTDIQQIALVQNEAQQPLWFINVNQHALSVMASSQLVARTDKDYELWMILKGQDTPISLGLLPKHGHKAFSKNSAFNASDITLLAVSLEPMGGSPNGLPTDVLYTTELVVL
ncbi:anti-sigma factor domain-containing protein [Pseudoalteromonas sp.]|uniref:anti-sigma factor n=1 Tax=Pseudoalteromonas sp. TaxID=53249 RepID=UPI0035631EDB